MKTQSITAKLKLLLSVEDRTVLLRTAMTYRDALNYASKVAFEHGKMSQGMKLQKLVYTYLRTKFALPSQMACNAPRQVAASYKTLWSRTKTNKEQRTKGWTKKTYRGLDTPPKYSALTLFYSHGRDFSFGKDTTVSIGTLAGRIRCAYQGYAKHTALVASGAKLGGAKLWLDPASKEWFLLVSVEIPVPELDELQLRAVKGVDVGQRFLAVESAGKNARFWSGKATMAKCEHFARVRQGLQRKGTRSATRRLRLLSLRETRFRADINHQLSKQLASPNTLIGFEWLKDIDDRTERRSVPKASKKRKRANRRRAGWSFADLQTKTRYKAVLNNSAVVYVDADYTSQACPQCGHASKANRPGRGLNFVCEACNYKLHADLVGARNIALRTLLVRQDWARTGSLSLTPGGSDVEAKAARLQRYAELRWSPEPNPHLPDESPEVAGI
jgi:IS605 OrfB family transposase